MLKATAKLLPYQEQGKRFLIEREAALLAFDVGLGKTITSLAALEELPDVHKVLVFVPASLKFQWEEEIHKFVDESECVVINGDAKMRNVWWMTNTRNGKKVKYYIANYELLLRDMKQIQLRNWDAIITDEATKISNPRAKSVRAIKTLKARYRFALTGTPISNRPDELWSIIDWCRPKYLGNYWSFLSRYTIKNVFHGIAGYRNLDQLAIRVKPLVLKRSKEECLPDLPEKRVIDVPIEMSAKEQKAYDAIKQELWEDMPQDTSVGSIAAAQHTLVKLLKLRLCVDALALLPNEELKAQESAKMEALDAILEELQGQQCIIFTEFSKMADILADHLKAYKITGSVAAEARNEVVEGFNRGENNILVMTRAGSMGLNLQAAKAVIHYDQPWSLAQKIQREGRAHRIGQKDIVLIYNLLVKKSVDEWMVKKLHKKQALSDKVLLSDVKELLEY